MTATESTRWLFSVSISRSGPNHRHRPVQRRQIHQGCLHPRVRVRGTKTSRSAASTCTCRMIVFTFMFVRVWFRETVEPSSTYENTLSITPVLADNKEKRGLALDGRLKDEDTNLASTTVWVQSETHLWGLWRFTSTGASPAINLLIKSSTSCHSSSPQAAAGFRKRRVGNPGFLQN